MAKAVKKKSNITDSFIKIKLDKNGNITKVIIPKSKPKK